MNYVLTVLKEQINSFYLAVRLSFYEVKSMNNNHYLGMGWELLNPLIQLGVYWIVFGMGIRGNQGVEVGGVTVPFIFWLCAGMSVWFFIHSSIMAGTKSIYQRLGMLSKMNFPLSTIPMYIILTNFYSHVLLVMAVSVIIFFSDSVNIDIQIIQLFYYMFATIVFLFSLSLVTSTLATLVRDVTMIVQSVLRMLLYLTPLLWVPGNLPGPIELFMKLNPIAYLVNGYRDALLGAGWFWDNLTYTAYFWSIVLLLLTVGSALHVRFRKYFIDYL